MTAFATTFDTPLGPFSLAISPALQLTDAFFGLPEAVLPERGIPSWQQNKAALAPFVRQFSSYFTDPTTAFTVPIAPLGTTFQQKVWTYLRGIQCGTTQSYKAVATALASAPRAVGHAAGANRIALLIPCHRVIATDGSLTGFAFGLEKKRWLLHHESGDVLFK